MTPLVRLAIAAGLFFVATFAVVPPPTNFFYSMALVATEFGYWFAIGSAITLLFGWSGSALARVTTLIGVTGTLLLSSSVYRAVEYQRTLPALLTETFGKPAPSAEYADRARPAPMVLLDLFLGIHSAPVRYDERVYATPDGEELRMDLYHPSYPHTSIPGIVVVHGGWWQNGDRNEHLGFNAYFAARNYVVAAIDYRLAPRHRFPTAGQDVRSAIEYLKSHAVELGLDPNRIALVGRGAGGQLALKAAYDANDPAIRGVVTAYASVDLKEAYANPPNTRLLDTRGALEDYLGGTPAALADRYAAASPTKAVRPNVPPTLIIHGVNDPIVSSKQSELLDAELGKAGVPRLLLRLPWATHACDKNFVGPCGQITLYAVEHFLGTVMKQGAPQKTTKPKPAKPAARAAQKPAQRAVRGT
jgi:acetyl esterase/lipase